jgi:hypothetical protein
MRENGFLAGKNSGPPRPPSLNIDCPGGFGIEPRPWISVIKSGPLEFAWVFNLNSGPPPGLNVELTGGFGIVYGAWIILVVGLNGLNT